MRLYQQQKELQKMFGQNKSIIIDAPSKIKNQDIQSRNYATVSLFCLTVTNPFRDKIMRIVFNQWFERFILLTILANCVFLAIDDPNEEEHQYQVISDFIFLVIFTVEMLLKIIAMGFLLKPFSYLRDAWNIVSTDYLDDLQLDFIVVIMGWISKVVTANNVSAIRVIRILRPLRTINSMPGMRRLVQSLLNSLPTLFDIFVLFMFFLIMFGTVATQLFGGLLNNRCINDVTGEMQMTNDGIEYFCADDGNTCQEGYTCQYRGSPEFDVASFDNILKSVLNIFIIITLEGWTDRMYYIRVATDTIAYDIFFILVVIIGCFFILNLMVAVQFSYLNMQFQEQKNKKEQAKKDLKDLDDSPVNNPIKVNAPPIAIEDEKKETSKIQDGFTQAINEQSDVPEENRPDLIIESEQADKKQEGVTNVLQASQKLQSKKQKPKKQKCIFLKKIQAKVLILIESRTFNIGIILLILLNTTFMAMEHYDMDDTLSTVINLGNSTMTCIFACEMILKLIGLGCRNYVKDGFNDFDAIIVIIGLLEFVNAGSKVLTVLRAFRLLRIFKIVKSWTTLKKILQTVLSSFSSIANLGLLMCLLIFIYALIGMQFLSGPIPNNEENEFRFHFNSFGYSLITIFVLLTAENWNSILAQFIDKDGFAASLYFVSLIIFGNIMLLNLFLAILLSFISENLDSDSPESSPETEKVDGANGGNAENNEVVEEQFDYIQERMRIKAALQQHIQKNEQVEGGENQNQSLNKKNKAQELKNEGDSVNEAFKLDKNNQNNEEQEIRIKDISVNIEGEEVQKEVKISEKSNEDDSDHERNPPNKQNQLEKPQEGSPQIQISEAKSDGGNNPDQSLIDPNPHGSGAEAKEQKINKTFKTKAKSTVLDIQGRSLFIFSQKSKVRLFLKATLQHPYFENFIFHLIGLNSLILAMDEPDLSDPYQNDTLSLFVNIISGIFIMEAVLKIIVLGFVIGKGTYLRDYWNILDFVIVSFSVLNWILDAFSDISVSFLRGFRALRALRPLRMVSKNEGMRVVVNSLLTSIPNLLNVLLISLLFFLVFGILGVQLFKGQLSLCNDSSIDYKFNCTGTFDLDGVQTDRQWITPFANFDDIFHSMVTFFEISSLENWPEVLFRTIDSVDLDYGPIPDNRPYVAILFVVFIFITTFFVMNLFVSVIVDKFNEEIRKKEGSHQFSEEQKEWVKMQRIMVHVNLKITPTMPKNSFRKLMFYIVTSSKFEFFISFVIAVNTLFLCMDYYNAPADYDRAIEIGNIVFISIFTLEAVLKLLAHGPRFYFLENWNKFDFTIVILSLIALDESLFSFKVTALRIIRVARLLRMVKASKGLRHLLKTLWLSVGNIANVGMLLGLMFFTFSVAGMDLFGSLQNSEFITDQANFRSFYIAFLTLFRAETGENWNGLMHDCYEQQGVIGVLYWITFQFVTHYILINVFVAVIYDSFNDVKASEDENGVLSLKRKDIKAFVKTWAIFCPNGEHYMKTTQFSAFLMKLPPPLGYEGHRIEQSKLNKIIFCLNIKNHLRENEGKVYFPEVMWTIFHSIIGNNDEQVHKCEQVVNIMKQLKRKYKGLGKNVTPDSLCGNKYYRTEMTVSKYLCARQIYKNWVKFKAQREKLKEERAKQAEMNLALFEKKDSNREEQAPMSAGSIRASDDNSESQLLHQKTVSDHQQNETKHNRDPTQIIHQLDLPQQKDLIISNVNKFTFKDANITIEEAKQRSREEIVQFENRNNQSQEEDEQSVSLSSTFKTEDLNEDLSSRSQQQKISQHLDQSHNNSYIDFAMMKGGIREKLMNIELRQQQQQQQQNELNVISTGYFGAKGDRTAMEEARKKLDAERMAHNDDEDYE